MRKEVGVKVLHSWLAKFALELQSLPPFLPVPPLEVVDLSSCLVSKPTVHVKGWGVIVVLNAMLPMLVNVAFPMAQESKPLLFGQLITLQPTSWALVGVRRGKRKALIARNEDFRILEFEEKDIQHPSN